MRFPDPKSIDPLLERVEYPQFARVTYEPDAPELDDVSGAAELATLAVSSGLEPGSIVAVGVGSRGIADLSTVTRAVVGTLQREGFESIVVPAMGSHGGASADGQRTVLADLGVTEEAIGCSIDARMETVRIGRSTVGESTMDVHFSRTALDADAILAINRIKPHTNFTGRIESGICKMLVVGFGKQAGARLVHETAIREGYEPVLERSLDVVLNEAPVIGGIGVIENVYGRTAAVEPVPADELLVREATLLERARAEMATLPYDEIDVLIVDEIGKDVSGTGLDTNVVGRYRVLNAEEPTSPSIGRIYVRNLTDGTGGNGHGIGLADVTRSTVADAIDLKQVYANALTSGSLARAALPVVLPTDEQALCVALSSVGATDPERARIVWIRNTGELSDFRVSTPLLDETPGGVSVTGYERVTFENGTLSFEPTVTT